MTLTRAIYRFSPFVLAGLLSFAFIGFWRDYFAIPFSQPDWRIHVHGISVILWCLLLVCQPYLIRTKRQKLHRSLGTISYLLVPIIVFSTLSLLHYTVLQFLFPSTELRDINFYFIALPHSLLLQFLFAYTLAMWYRRDPLIHARFMICTVFPLLPPIFSRILERYVMPPPNFLPAIDGLTLYPLLVFAASDLVLIGLVIWDRNFRKPGPFVIVLVGFVALQAAMFLAYRFPIWRAYAEWFMGLPLS